MKQMKQYAVEVVGRECIGKDFFFGMYLYGYSKKDAEEAGYTTISEMTFDELFERIDDEEIRKNFESSWIVKTHDYELGKDAQISYKYTRVMFTCKAYIEK